MERLSLALLSACCFYYPELFTSLEKNDLLNDANFRAVCGIAFYSICTLSTMFVLSYFYSSDFVTYQRTFNIIFLYFLLLWYSNHIYTRRQKQI